ncbi:MULTISPECIES: hypothetical protein [unclassified Mucilaginibacter]|uniref:hypothetical protein n=1 Tax=unclassified Mucilaginibacter TaxID=2617802 RepID=UPI00138D4F81|nr:MULTISPECIES: hypothetical protein [unclassified Mucilaginibacter]MBB5396771.1 transposase-like protein [Mucilaginibacter sp. AK015]QHS55401.1 hypothetical protein GWR56_07555 [Mucilaginibacter sp. 14171R-50]
MELIFNEQKATMKVAAEPKQDAACPRCGRNACERIKRGILVKTFLPWLKLKRYRCHGCMHAFYKVKS